MVLNQKRVEHLVEVLKILPISDKVVDMMCGDGPDGLVIGCHAALVHGVFNSSTQDEEYSWEDAASRVAKFLFDDDRAKHGDLELLADQNPEWWGNDSGGMMFCCGSAFGMDSDVFPSSVIVDHWAEVASRGHMVGDLI
jgi:hypothetical protein